MIPAAFEYHRAGSLEEAVELLGRLPDAKLLAGGHSLLPMMKLRLAAPAAVVDIARVQELSGIEERGDRIAIGALTRHAELAASETLRRHCPLLAEAAAEIGDPQVRNRGTVGGNIAHADPASDLPAVLVAVGATIHAVGPSGERSVAAGDFFVDLLVTDLGPDEVLTRIEVPKLTARDGRTGSAYVKHEHPASGYALCGAAAVVTLGEGDAVAAASLAFNGVAPRPVAVSSLPDGLAGRPFDAEAAAGALADLAVDDALSDTQASAEYRVELARVYGRRALALAAERARGA